MGGALAARFPSAYRKSACDAWPSFFLPFSAVIPLTMATMGVATTAAMSQ